MKCQSMAVSMCMHSLLPKYRGAGPIQWAVINGEKESGVTTMYMCREIDKGDMLLQAPVTLDPKETGDSLHDKLSMMGGPLLLKTIDQLEDGSAVRIPQCEEESTYAPKLEQPEILTGQWMLIISAISSRLKFMARYLYKDTWKNS